MEAGVAKGAKKWRRSSQGRILLDTTFLNVDTDDRKGSSCHHRGKRPGPALRLLYLAGTFVLPLSP